MLKFHQAMIQLVTMFLMNMSFIEFPPDIIRVVIFLVHAVNTIFHVFYLLA